MFFVILCIVLLSTISEGSDFDSPAIYQVTAPVDHAEGPTWDGRNNILYYVDIHSGGILAYHYDSKKLSKINLNGEVTPVIPSRKNPQLLLVGLNRSVVAVEWDGKKNIGEQEILTTISNEFPKSRFNDGKADKQGRLWWGTIGQEDFNGVKPNEGIFYQITRENIKNPTVVRSPISNSNGLAWNKANDKLYYIDSSTLKVVEFAYDDKKGNISDENRTVFDIAEYSDKITGIPDGMTIDDEDNLYICLYGGGSVLKVNPSNGKILKTITLPARDVTSATWGGPKHDILFVTTSRHSLSVKEKLAFPAAGSLFAVKNLNAKGLPVYTADIIDEIPKKLNLLENLFAPEIFSAPRETKTVHPRNTELSIWDTVVNVLSSFF